MKLPKLYIPVTVVLFGLMAIPLKAVFDAPSAQLTKAGAQDVYQGDFKSVELTVEGVKCKGTANFFISRYQNVVGIIDITAYASDHKVVIKYDPQLISLERIKQIADEPAILRDGSHRAIFKVLDAKETE